VLVAAVVIALSFDGGSSTEVTSLAAILLWWTVLVAVLLGIWPVAPVPRAGWAAVLALGAFAAWTAASIAWAPSAERAVAELGRVTLYLGVALVAVLAVRRRAAARWADGLAAGIAVVGALAIAQRLVPGFGSSGGIPALLPEAALRLSYPVGYWNGLGILLALALPLLLRAAAAERHPAIRGLAVLPIPVLSTALYLTSSRGGVAAAAAGAVVLLLAGARRFATAQALAVAAAGSAVALAVLRSQPQLVDGPLTPGLIEAQGPAVALAIAGFCVAAAAVYAVVAVFAPATTA